MPIRYKGDILAKLKEKGYSTSRLRKEKIFGERTMQEFRTNGVIPYKTLDKLCGLLECQPGDFLEYVPDETSGQDSAAPAAKEKEVV